MDPCYDLAIIGGGINGTAIAADAALRGLSVALFEKGDLASQTSSSSTKLIHGGLRYLEYGQFSMVKKSLYERKLLLNLAPHLIAPQALVLPYVPSMRPRWLLQTGLFLYDWLAGNHNIAKSKRISRKKNPEYFLPLKNELEKGFLFYECLTDDARLTLENALQAKSQGAAIFTHTEVLEASAKDSLWDLRIKTDQEVRTIQARAVINASGPWVLKVDKLLNKDSPYEIALIKGSHVVVPALYRGKQAYLLQHDDKRVIFVIPFHGYSLIGTTDQLYLDTPKKLTISPEEIYYLLTLVNQNFKSALVAKDIISSWSGLRTLLKNGATAPQALSRDYVFHFSDSPAPVISIYSGKITSYRQLAVEVVDQLAAVFPGLKASSTDKQPLPGAFYGKQAYAEYRHYAMKEYDWLEPALLSRLLNTYGCHTEQILAAHQKTTDLGRHFGQGLYQAEVDYLVSQEWARNSEDILWRRTKLGLSFSPEEEAILRDYLCHPREGGRGNDTVM